MAQTVFDLGLQPTKRAKGQADRHLKRSENQRKVQTANQIESAQQLQSSLLPLPKSYTKPLGLQEIGKIFDQETQRMWDIDLRERGLADGTETREMLSQLHHELFRVNQCKILDRYWKRSGVRISQKTDAREIARMEFRRKMYERCKEWFKNKNSKAYLCSQTELQLQLRDIPNDTAGFSNDEGTLSPFRRAFVRPRETLFSNNDEQVSCAYCSAQYCAQSLQWRTSSSPPDTVGPGFYDEVGERPPDTNNSVTPISTTSMQCPFLPFIRDSTGRGQNQYKCVGPDTTFDECEQLSRSWR